MAKQTRVQMLTSKAALRVVDLDEIGVDKSYQRDVVPRHKKIVAEFNEDALGIPVVGQREDGSLWIVDGLQRITALRKLGKKTLRAEVFVSDGPEHEAEVFKLINQNRTRLRPDELYNSLLTAGDTTAWALKETAEKHGFTVSRGRGGVRTPPETSSKVILCVAVAYRLVKDYGTGPLDFALSVIPEAWPDDPAGVKFEVIYGLAIFWHRRDKGKGVDRDRLIPRLRLTTPSKIIYAAGIGTGSRMSNAADVIERFYKKRVGKRD